MKQFIERIGAVRLSLAILLIMSLLSVLLGYREGLVPILLGGFLVTALIGLAEIVDAIREGGVNVNHIRVSVDEVIREAVRRDVLREQAKTLGDLKPKHRAAQANKATEDEAVHCPLTEAPEDGTLVYLHTMGEGKNIVPTAYAGAYHSQALREGRIYRSKKDALVHLYGQHYSTLKPEGEIGRGTLLRELDNYSQTTHNQMKQEQIKALQERMQSYIGTKHIRAVEMTRGEYNALRDWTVPEDENPADEGYLVEYQNSSDGNVEGFNGYISWSPKQAFEEAYKVANTAIDRLMIELNDLDKNADSLSFFIKRSSCEKEIKMLDTQRNLMWLYSGILRERIEHEKKKQTSSPENEA